MSADPSPTPDPWDAACPSRELLAMVGDKWALLLMPLLADGPRRNADLQRRLDGISQKMLTQTLRNMERNGLVHRRDFHEVPPRVEYALTDLGRSLARVVGALDDWVVANYRAVERARKAFETASGPAADP